MTQLLISGVAGTPVREWGGETRTGSCHSGVNHQAGRHGGQAGLDLAEDSLGASVDTHLP